MHLPHPHFDRHRKVQITVTVGLTTALVLEMFIPSIGATVKLLAFLVSLVWVWGG